MKAEAESARDASQRVITGRSPASRLTTRGKVERSRGWTTRHTEAACCAIRSRRSSASTRTRSSAGPRASVATKSNPADADLTAGHPGEPIGERIIVTGRLLDATGTPVAGQLVEIWQANAAGRYNHDLDQHPAPIDPNFTGAGRCLTEPRRNVPLSDDQAGPLPVA